MRKRKKALWTVVVIVSILVLARIALPFVVKEHINDKIAKMGDYHGHVEDVDLFLLLGAYHLDEVTVVKVGVDSDSAFLDMDSLELSIEWPALLKRRLVGEVRMISPVLNLVQGKSDEDSQLGRGVNWPDEVRELFPFQINRLEVVDALVTFRTPGIDSDDSLTLRHLHGIVEDLTNVRGSDEEAFANISFNGGIMGHAPLSLTGRIDPTDEESTFDLSLSIEGARLTEANPWLDEYLHVDAEQGEFSMYSELASANGKFRGYIKPIMKNPVVFRMDEEADNPLRKIWEGVVQLAMKIFENPPEDQVATRIPFSGELENPDSDILASIVNLLRNAFVAAFTHSIDNSISLEDVRGEEAGGDDGAD